MAAVAYPMIWPNLLIGAPVAMSASASLWPGCTGTVERGAAAERLSPADAFSVRIATLSRLVQD